MDSSLYHDPLIILYFRPYASGNFLANVLSHNREFVPKFPFNYTRRNVLDGKKVVKMSDDELFATQLEIIKGTIPDSLEECRKWGQYELMCYGFWSKDRDTFHAMNDVELWIWKSNLRIEPFHLMKRNKRCFIIMHDLHRQGECYKHVFPNATTVQLINDNLTITKGSLLKGPSYRRDPAPPILPGAILFDIDSLWHKDKFFENIDNLLEKLNVKDKTLDPAVYDYYNRYINLYNYL